MKSDWIENKIVETTRPIFVAEYVHCVVVNVLYCLKIYAIAIGYS